MKELFYFEEDKQWWVTFIENGKVKFAESDYNLADVKDKAIQYMENKFGEDVTLHFIKANEYDILNLIDA